MPKLTFTKITCENINSDGGLIELREVPPESRIIWRLQGKQPMQPGNSITFGELSPDEQPDPIDFFDQVEIVLWDQRYNHPVDKIAVATTESNGLKTFSYFPPGDPIEGNMYTLSYIVESTVTGMATAYVVSGSTLIINFLVDFKRLTIETACSITRLIFAPFNRLVLNRNNKLDSISENGMESTQKNDSEPVRQ